MTQSGSSSLPVAIDSNGGMGPAALALFMEAFHAKRGVATTDRERWDAIKEQQSLFAAISAVVQRRKFAILVGNARPGSQLAAVYRVHPE